jgi:streptogramin lyase
VAHPLLKKRHIKFCITLLGIAGVLTACGGGIETGTPISPTPVLQLKAFTAGITPGFPSSAVTWDITPGAGDSMWFDGSPTTPAIGTITAQGTVHEYGLPLPSAPYSIVSDGSKNAWFTDAGTGSLGRITPAGKIDEFTDQRLKGLLPSGITIAPDHSI